MILTSYAASVIPAGKKHSQLEILEALYFRDGARAVSFKAYLLDRDNSPVGEIELTGGGVDFDAFAEIKRSGTFETRYTGDANFLANHLQPVFVLRLPGEDIEFPLGIFLIASSPPSDDGKGISLKLKGYDFTAVLLWDTLDAPLTVPEGTVITNYVSHILTEARFTRARVVGSAAETGRDMMWEAGTSKLQVVNDLLASINYTEVWFDRNGFAMVEPYALPIEREVDVAYIADETSVIMPGVANEMDLFEIPNKIRVTATNNQMPAPLVSVWENRNPRSPLSIDRVGWVRVREERVNDITDQVTLDAYVRRLAYNAGDRFNSVPFSTPCMPLHDYYNCVYLGYPRLGLADRFIEAGWSMDFTGGMNHKLRRQVEILV